jgi:hypothetical protein
VIEGAREQVIINIMDGNFFNFSDEVRRRIDLRKVDESLLSTEIDPSVRESSVADRSTIASSIVSCDSNHYDNDDNSSNNDWIAEEAEEAIEMNNDEEENTSLEAVLVAQLQMRLTRRELHQLWQEFSIITKHKHNLIDQHHIVEFHRQM